MGNFPALTITFKKLYTKSYCPRKGQFFVFLILCFQSLLTLTKNTLLYLRFWVQSEKRAVGSSTAYAITPKSFIQKTMALGKVKTLILWPFFKTFWSFSNTNRSNLGFGFSLKIRLEDTLLQKQLRPIFLKKCHLSDLLTVFWSFLDKHPAKNDIIALIDLTVCWKQVKVLKIGPFSGSFFYLTWLLLAISQVKFSIEKQFLVIFPPSPATTCV